ncbi:nucleic acid binding/RNA binding protein [Wolffia australiana]
MQGGEELSIRELASNLSIYKDQLRQVKELLLDEPGNSEYADMEKELQEVITLTEELLAAAKQGELPGLPVKSDGEASPSHALGTQSEAHEFSVGDKIQAVWSEDGEWYNATVEALTPNGYLICYDEWGNKEEVDPGNVRPREVAIDTLREAERVAEATKLAIKRKIAQAADAEFSSRPIPPKLQINPDDPEDVKAAKRKKIHAFKSKVRFEKLEVVQNKRQNAWQQFQSSKGQSKKVGFFTGRKKESIFKSPDDPQGKVGVTGSGKGLTDFLKREKHLHLKGANGEVEE